jgi:hypothetical protein
MIDHKKYSKVLSTLIEHRDEMLIYSEESVLIIEGIRRDNIIFLRIVIPYDGPKIKEAGFKTTELKEALAFLKTDFELIPTENHIRLCTDKKSVDLRLLDAELNITKAEFKKDLVEIGNDTELFDVAKLEDSVKLSINKAGITATAYSQYKDNAGTVHIKGEFDKEVSSRFGSDFIKFVQKVFPDVTKIHLGQDRPLVVENDFILCVVAPRGDNA